MENHFYNKSSSTKSDHMSPFANDRSESLNTNQSKQDRKRSYAKGNGQKEEHTPK